MMKTLEDDINEITRSLDSLGDITFTKKVKREEMMCISCTRYFPKSKLASHQLNCIKNASPKVHKSAISQRLVKTSVSTSKRSPQIDRDSYSQRDLSKGNENTSEKDIMNEQVVSSNEERQPCPHCGRKFSEEALARHEPKCAVIPKSTRKVFDSSKARMEGTQLKEFAMLNRIKASTIAEKDFSTKGNDVITSAKRKIGGAKPKTKFGESGPTKERVGRVEIHDNADHLCKHCFRKFSESSLERHEPICRSITEKEQMREREQSKRKSSEQYRLLQRRRSYKPPAPVGSSR